MLICRNEKSRTFNLLFTERKKNCPHCPKINLHLRIKAEPVTVGPDATLYVWFLCQRADISCTVASSPTVTGLVGPDAKHFLPEYLIWILPIIAIFVCSSTYSSDQEKAQFLSLPRIYIWFFIMMVFYWLTQYNSWCSIISSSLMTICMPIQAPHNHINTLIMMVFYCY